VGNLTEGFSESRDTGVGLATRSKHGGLLSLTGRNSGCENEEGSVDLEAVENEVDLRTIYRVGEQREASGQATAGDGLLDFNASAVPSFESAPREGEMEGRGREMK
jgi:hypothetical protein